MPWGCTNRLRRKYKRRQSEPSAERFIYVFLVFRIIVHSDSKIGKENAEREEWTKDRNPVAGDWSSTEFQERIVRDQLTDWNGSADFEGRVAIIVPQRLDSPEDDAASLLSLGSFAKEYRLPPRTETEAPPLAHRHTAPPKVTLPSPHPLKSNPPEPKQTGPLSPAIGLDGCNVQLLGVDGNQCRNSGHDETNPARISSEHIVLWAGTDPGSPLLPFATREKNAAAPESESSSSSSQVTPIAEDKSQKIAESASHPRRSRQSPIGPLPLEMRESLKIWQRYTATGIIDVDICPEALDGGGNYTWMHCWGLFNIYPFGASFMDNIEFTDRVMDMLCKNIKPGQAADVDTISLIFTTRNISSRLKRFVVDRCIDARAKNFH
ncbi:hypothetical protein BU23DRAFT_571020 [Bimuria novae-zelandiae CBS 107.79]|uniref:Uncharacterized protein n=1 Tax=Bimuria novae-zelandiae CBS 107.79 TaxID=1447943 RepID=A0A6A5V5B6_9PLEO|nr:hypothetical protein BU23DRAFT_571020 [Bimuria novae-zelandiae CBS 107.79]